MEQHREVDVAPDNQVKVVVPIASQPQKTKLKKKKMPMHLLPAKKLLLQKRARINWRKRFEFRWILVYW
jgi:hypothetical protein